MAHEILSIKLRQLDDRLKRLHRCIRMSETASHSQLRQEIRSLEQDCTQEKEALRESLQHSKSELAALLSQDYGQMEQIIGQSRARLQAAALRNPNREAVMEEQLLAEYALDFAHQAADRALLLSMEAIDTQLLQQQEGRTL